MFRRRTPTCGTPVRVEIRTIDGVATLVEQHGTMPEQHLFLRDLVLIRRVRGLDLDDDRWLFAFRPEGVVEVQGKPGGKLAKRVGRARPDVEVHVHHPDDD